MAAASASRTDASVIYLFTLPCSVACVLMIRFTVALPEFIYLSATGLPALFACVGGMAARADFNSQVSIVGRAGFKRVSTVAATYGYLAINRVVMRCHE